jgi:hypothetical protein
MRVVPEVYADGCEVVLCEFVLGELHQEGGFTHAGTTDQNQLHQLVVLFYHTLRFIIILLRVGANWEVFGVGNLVEKPLLACLGGEIVEIEKK